MYNQSKNRAAITPSTYSSKYKIPMHKKIKVNHQGARYILRNKPNDVIALNMIILFAQKASQL